MKAKQAVSQHPLLPLPAAELLLGLLSQVTEQISLPGVPKLSEDLFFLIYQGKKKSQAPESTPPPKTASSDWLYCYLGLREMEKRNVVAFTFALEVA